MFLLFGIILATELLAQDETFEEKIKSIIQHEFFTVNVLVQTGFRYSFENNDFQNGRTFEVANARLSFKGIIEDKFYYRVFFNLAREPNLLDAFVGYRFGDCLLITAGAMKPKQTLDYIPDPGSTDFIDRTKITGLLVQSREIGLSAEGNIGGLYYFTGIFNGNKLSLNNNNKFYGIGRLQYTFADIMAGQLQVAVQGSHGRSDGVRSGSSGPTLRGERTIYGGDIKMETNKFLLAAEYLEGTLETEDFSDRKEKINGYYFTAGYKFFENTMFLARWQSWSFKQFDFRDNQFTFGVNHEFSNITSFQFNFDTFLPEYGDKHYGLSLLIQVQF